MDPAHESLPDEELTGRTAPHSVEEEMSVLGAMMIESQAVDSVLGMLQPDDFYVPAHREVYQAMLRVREEGHAIDIVTLKDDLEARGLLNRAGGVALLVEMARDVPSASNADSYARRVKQYATLRQLQRVGRQISDLVTEKNLSTKEKLGRAEAMVYELSGADEKGFRSLSDLSHQTFEEAEKLKQGIKPVEGISSGYPSLDRIITGFEPGHLIVVAARPAMGKTSLGLNMALSAARREDGGAVAVFSLEMTSDQLIKRLISMEKEVMTSTMRKVPLHQNDFDRIADACDELNDLPIYIDEQSDMTVMRMAGMCRRLDSELRRKGDQGLSMIFVDYLQLIKHPGKSESRNTEIGEIARGLKELSKSLKVPVVAAAQVNRAVEGRHDKRPMLSDLRESGSIEAEADVVMSIYRDSYYKRDPDEEQVFDPELPEIAEVEVLKNRHGGTGTVYMAFKPAFTQFTTASQDFIDSYLTDLREAKATGHPTVA